MHGLDATRMAVAGESVGGNMTAAPALMATYIVETGEPLATFTGKEAG